MCHYARVQGDNLGGLTVNVLLLANRVYSASKPFYSTSSSLPDCSRCDDMECVWMLLFHVRLTKKQDEHSSDIMPVLLRLQFQFPRTVLLTERQGSADGVRSRDRNTLSPCANDHSPYSAYLLT